MSNKTFAGACGALSVLAASCALAAPTELGLTELDRITAGGAGSDGANPPPNGGAIVGNGSTATLVSSGEVLVADEAQTEARALNLVNSSESTVANGVNVFDGRIQESTALAGAELDISQRNVVAQDQRRLSSLPQYERGANTETLQTSTGTATSNSSFSSLEDITDLERTTVIDSATTNGSYDRSGAPTIRIEAEGDLVLGGDSPFFDGDGRYSAEFNTPSAGNSAGVVFNGELDYSIDGGEITIDTGDVGVIVAIDLPELDLDFDAMGCVAVNGNCTIDGTRTESTDVISDHSTLSSTEESSSSSETWDNVSHDIVNAAFELRDGQAEYIVVDESTIDVAAAYLVSLSGGAQSGLRAMNAVNAAGSAVANGVNVAAFRSGSLEVAGVPAYNLSQVNEIVHSR